ncbi:hypothetical protein GVAV_001414 [Gurleya vavrai]
MICEKKRSIGIIKMIQYNIFFIASDLDRWYLSYELGDYNNWYFIESKYKLEEKTKNFLKLHGLTLIKLLNKKIYRQNYLRRLCNFVNFLLIILELEKNPNMFSFNLVIKGSISNIRLEDFIKGYKIFSYNQILSHEELIFFIFTLYKNINKPK